MELEGLGDWAWKGSLVLDNILCSDNSTINTI